MNFARRISALQGSPIDDIEFMLKGRTDLIPFGGGSPCNSDLPMTELKEIALSVLSDDPSSARYGPTHGENSLREAIVERYPNLRLGSNPDMFMITAGSLQALDITFRVFLDPQDLVVVESPTFSDTLASLSSYSPDIVEVDCDEEGLKVDQLEAAIEKVGRVPKLIYVIPTFQNPSGVTLELDRRRALLSYAQKIGALLVEDDPYGELRFRGAPIPSLWELDVENSTVISTRSFSKLIAPGLRVGWLMAPIVAMHQMVLAKQGMDICSNVLGQRIIGEYLRRGLLQGQIAKLNSAYKARKEAMVTGLKEQFGDVDRVRWTDPDGGYFIWLTLPDAADVSDLFELAVREGVSFIPGNAFSPSDRFDHALRLCFASAEVPQISEGVRRLRKAYDRLS